MNVSEPRLLPIKTTLNHFSVMVEYNSFTPTAKLGFVIKNFKK